MVTLLAGLLGSVAATLRSVRTWVTSQRAKFDEATETYRTRVADQREGILRDAIDVAGGTTAQAGTGAGLPDEVIEAAAAFRTDDRRVADLEADVNVRRQQIGMAARHRDLLDFVRQRLEGRYYEDKLGLLHQVKSDLKQLSESMIDEPGGSNELFPRGRPRIFLLIDDLDRCPPNKVVEVLEAAQLLLKTELFVIVLAIDVRYITRALEKEYVDVLTRGGHPSGFDYIEKIIQIPYRVRPVPREALQGFLRHEMGIEEREVARDAEEEETRLQENIADTRSVLPAIEDQSVVEPARLAQTRSARRELGVLPTRSVEFSAVDLRLISQCCAEYEVSPRTMKRLVNVFKLLKILWYREGLDEGPPIPVRQTILAMLVIAARQPEVTRHLIHEMERRYASQESIDDRLVDYLERRCRERRVDALIPSDWDEMIETLRNPRLFPPDVSFAELGDENMRLVAMFCFVGESDSEREAALRRDRRPSHVPAPVTP